MTDLNYKSLLIVTYGRSGSTLLQGVLNDIDGVLIKGENFNFCFNLYQSHQSLVNAKLKAGNSKSNTNSPTAPWFGAGDYDLEKYKKGLGKVVEELLLGDVAGVYCYGFKEIRYAEIPETELLGYLNFLMDIFPNLGVVFNTRDLDEVVKSGWWKTKKSRKTKKLLGTVEVGFRKYSSMNNNCFTISYADVVNKTKVLEELHDFIGAKYDEKRIDRVLAKSHSYGQSENVLNKLSSMFVK